MFRYSNRIKQLEGLDSLSALEYLSVSDNDISAIKGLDNQVNLSTLLLGNNKIKSIGNSLNGCVNLRELNISGNQISSFREILHLARLKKLEHLSLSDPNYSDNPICALCNYQTYIIHHLPKIVSFDTLSVTAESRKTIGATIVKKRMYYNMRIITIRRNSNFLIKSLKNSTASVVEAMEIESEQKLAFVKKYQLLIDTIRLVDEHPYQVIRRILHLE